MLTVILILWGASAVAMLAMFAHHCWRTRNLKAAWRQKDEDQ